MLCKRILAALLAALLLLSASAMAEIPELVPFDCNGITISVPKTAQYTKDTNDKGSLIYKFYEGEVGTIDNGFLYFGTFETSTLPTTAAAAESRMVNTLNGIAISNTEYKLAEAAENYAIVFNGEMEFSQNNVKSNYHVNGFVGFCNARIVVGIYVNTVDPDSENASLVRKIMESMHKTAVESGIGIDLSGMSYDELVSLKDQINMAIWNNEKWQEVTVPEGVWIVGEDIPEGRWTIKCPAGYRRTRIDWGDCLSDNGERISWNGTHSVYNDVYNPDHKSYEPSDGVTEYTFTAVSGKYVVIQYAPAVFTPFAGKPSLGFK